MCTLATLYSPNSSRITFLEEALAQFQNFAEGTLVIGGGGDFNVTLSPDIDSTGHNTRLTYSALSEYSDLRDAISLTNWLTPGRS